MTPREFLDVATDLLRGHREGDWRSALSRAYYALFHTASQIMVKCGFVVPIAETAHAYLWLRLSNCNQPDMRQVGAELRRMRSLRNRADYDLVYELLETTAAHAVVMADDMIQILESLETAATIQVEVIDAIRQYERDVLKEETWHGGGDSA